MTTVAMTQGASWGEEQAITVLEAWREVNPSAQTSASLEVRAIYANALEAEEQSIAARMWDRSCRICESQ